MIPRWPIDGSLPPRMTDEQLDELLAEVDGLGRLFRPVLPSGFRSPLNAIRARMEARDFSPERLRLAAQNLGPDHLLYDLAMAEVDAQSVAQRLQMSAMAEGLPW